jgi:hypothetical protein
MRQHIIRGTKRIELGNVKLGIVVRAHAAAFGAYRATAAFFSGALCLATAAPWSRSLRALWAITADAIADVRLALAVPVVSVPQMCVHPVMNWTPHASVGSR